MEEMTKSTLLKGFVWKFGDNVDTDVIIPARHLATTNPEQLAKHCMEDLDPEFAGKVQVGDIMVAQDNFGCGSSREHAPISIKAVGVSAIIANTFARIFFRNSINIGLPIFECPEAVANIDEKNEVEIDLQTGLIKNLTKGTSFQSKPYPKQLRDLIDAGGLIPYTKLKLEGKI